VLKSLNRHYSKVSTNEITRHLRTQYFETSIVGYLRHLEIGWYRSHSRSLETAPFDRSHTSYSVPFFLIIKALYLVSLLVENRNVFMPRLYLEPRSGWLRRNFANILILINLEWLVYGVRNKLRQHLNP